MRCLGERPTPHLFDEDEDEPLTFRVSPFECTHYYMAGPTTDHPHEFERHWGIDTLKDRELLQSCAEIYDRLDDLVHDAHRRLGAEMPSHRTPDSKRALPCMEDLTKYRVVRTVIENGKEIWKDEPSDLHSH